MMHNILFSDFLFTKTSHVSRLQPITEPAFILFSLLVSQHTAAPPADPAKHTALTNDH